MHQTPRYICNCSPFEENFSQVMNPVYQFPSTTTLAKKKTACSPNREFQEQQLEEIRESKRVSPDNLEEVDLNFNFPEKLKGLQELDVDKLQSIQPELYFQPPATYNNLENLNHEVQDNVEQQNSETISDNEMSSIQDSQVQSSPNSKIFECITCKRGPPLAKRYAKGQCQTCYKRCKIMTGLQDEDERIQILQNVAQQLFKQMKREQKLSCKQVVKQYFKINSHQVGKIDKKELRKYLKMLGPPSNKHMGREPRDFVLCPGCKRSGVRHYARGYCSICYRKMKKRNSIAVEELQEQV